jgi:cytochrome c biogenesis protein
VLPAGVKGKLWATFVPAEPPPAADSGAKPRGVSIVARDFQAVALYKADGTFAGVRRPGSNKPIEVGSTTREMRTAFQLTSIFASYALRDLGKV